MYVVRCSSAVISVIGFIALATVYRDLVPDWERESGLRYEGEGDRRRVSPYHRVRFDSSAGADSRYVA